MNEKIKKQWIEALRSGEYKQGKNYLRNIENNFCCLGVLTDLYCKEKNEEWELIEKTYYFDVSKVFLSEKVEGWSGLQNEYSIGTLMTMNDSGKTFKEIADYIEKKL